MGKTFVKVTAEHDESGQVRPLFLYIENPTLDVGFKKAYSYTDDRKTPFDRMSCGLPTATKISKGGHSRSERHPQSITHKMEL